MMQENYSLWGGSENPRPRHRSWWAIGAVAKAERDHVEKFGSQPREIHMSRDFYVDLCRELWLWSDGIAQEWPLHGKDLNVFGMKVVVE